MIKSTHFLQSSKTPCVKSLYPSDRRDVQEEPAAAKPWVQIFGSNRKSIQQGVFIANATSLWKLRIAGWSKVCDKEHEKGEKEAKSCNNSVTSFHCCQCSWSQSLFAEASSFPASSLSSSSSPSSSSSSSPSSSSPSSPSSSWGWEKNHMENDGRRNKYPPAGVAC